MVLLAYRNGMRASEVCNLRIDDVDLKGGRLHRSQFFRLFQAIAESVGLPTDKRHPHVLKHSLASHLVAGNCNLALVKQQLGHASISSTMMYIGNSDQQASEAASAVLMAMY